MYRPPKTNHAVRVRPLADVLIGDSTIMESTANQATFGQSSGLPVYLQASGSNEAGTRYEAKHTHTMPGNSKAAIGVQLVFPENEAVSYHYQYTIGLEGTVQSTVNTLPVVAYRFDTAISNNEITKRYSMLPLPPIHADNNDRWCVSDHYVEIGEIDYPSRESLAGATRAHGIFFGVMFHNISSSTINLNGFEVHAHAYRYYVEQPTFDPATIR